MATSRRVGRSRDGRYGCQAPHQETAESTTMAGHNGTTRSWKAAG